ncbi:unnamed protein product [Chrysodeixis includens]|uniref:Acyltransferase 3 domain-containing protein n=1 Tax=Chrysodeixis includens TaxID=689277 RepID=A0A9N8Q1P2_CHRIL|nr:unnamed protein product [Chrysodeixis includens]
MTHKKYRLVTPPHQFMIKDSDEPPESIFDYHSMPALSDLDDFDLCLKKPDAVYCIVDLVLLEDDTPLYQFIKNFSSLSYTNYQHSKLHRGVCGSKHCGLNISHADAGQSTADALRDCLNASIHQGYGLQVDTLSVRYCKTKDDYKPPDTLDYIVGVLLLALLLVNLGCSAYYFLKPSENGEANKYMLAFCIQKNWKALKHGGSAEGGLFKCFQALRFYTMVMILGLHSMIFIGYGYTANPEFIENALLFNARVIVQIFFVMGGFLMAYKMLVLMPAVLVVMGLAMTWVPHMGSGPMWDAVVKREKDMCRMNWWQLVILSPNLFPFEHLCLPQAWYLGTDTQLFLITLVILLIIWRWPRSGVPVLSAVMAISLLIPFLQSYFMNLLPIRVSIFPESIRDIFGYNDTFYHAYVSAQGNWAGYHLGVLTAYFYHKAQQKKWDLGDSIYLLMFVTFKRRHHPNSFIMLFQIMKFLFLVSIPVALGTVLMGWDLHHREASAFESAVFNALNQNFFALAICVFIIGYFYKCNRIYVSSVEWGPLQPLGRMSYCAMLLHATVLRTYGGQMRRSFYATDYTAIMLYAGIVSTTYLFALPLYLFVEAPACQLQKLLLGPKRKPREKEDTNANHVKPGISNVAEYTTTGANHTEGGWPKDVNINDPEATQRYRRKVEKDDAYIHCVTALSPVLDRLVLQNNAIDMYQTYYTEMDTLPAVEHNSCRTVNQFQDVGINTSEDSNVPRRPITSICWQPEGGHHFAATYVGVDQNRQTTSPVTAFIWNVDNPNNPETVLGPPCPMLDLQYNPKDIHVLAGGLINGQVCTWDLRQYSMTPALICPPHVAHRDLVKNVLFINSKTGMEFFSGGPDGVCKWWDIRKFNEPTEEMIIDVVTSMTEEQSMARANGVSVLEFESTIPTRFMVGTENGLVINGNRKGKTALDKLPAKFNAHVGPVWRVERNPGFLKNFLTVGDWTARVWSEECRESAIMWTAPARHRITDCAWSPTRCVSARCLPHRHPPHPAAVT